MLISVLIYFLIAILFSAFCLLSPVRDRADARARFWWEQTRDAGAGWLRRGSIRRRSLGRVMFDLARGVSGGLRLKARPLVLAALVLGSAPLAVWLVRGDYHEDSFDPEASHQIDVRVAALLQGEQLVAPLALPPELFSSPDVERWQPLARSASRQWGLLDADFRQRLLLAFKLMGEQHGYEMVLIEGYRSPERQAALAALGPTVTRAGPFESAHQYGLAADVAFLHDGKIVISERDPWAMQAYRSYGDVARSVGLTWGGDWPRLKDFGHVESIRAGAASQIPRTPA